MRVVRRDPNKGYIDDWLWIPQSFVNVNSVKQSLTHKIADYSGHEKLVYLYKEAPHHLLVPRAYWNPSSLPFDVVDCRPRRFTQVSFKTRIKLDHLKVEGKLIPTGDDVQQKSMGALQQAMGGVLQLACGKGKTIIALEYIARSQMPAIIMLDNTNLFHQWMDDIREHLVVPGGVGVIAGGKKDWKKGLVLGTYHSVANWADTMPEEVRSWFGSAFWDEGHHLSAPVFSKSAPLFYGFRFLLTATPERDDGMHIIADMHVGRVLFKDLREMMPSRIIFKWTGLELDLTDPTCDVTDVNGEIHTSKVYTYLGKWRHRLWVLVQDCIDAVSTGRKVLLLSNSVDEVVNLMTLWTRGPHTPLYSDVPTPTNTDVGSTLTPLALDDKEGKRLKANIAKQKKLVEKPHNPTKQAELEGQLASMEQDWERYQVHRKILRELEKRQKAFLRTLIDEVSSAGVMTYGVPPARRQEFLDSRPVVFAITKYGKEGLDCPELDTVLVSTPFSSKNGLQQLKGRPTRIRAGKKPPLIVIYRDNIGVMHGMCQKLESHLRSWPHEEGGPFDFEYVDNPQTKRWQKATSLKDAFGQL